jgi:hypothetical protein
VAADGTIHVIYMVGQKLYATRSTDGGLTWSTRVRVDDDTSDARKFTPDLAVLGSGALAAVWADERGTGMQTYMALSTDGGATWSANTAVTTIGGFRPRIVADPATSLGIFLVFCDDIGDTDNSYFIKSANAGSTWTAPAAITSGLYSDINPQLVLKNQEMYAFVETRARTDDNMIYMRRSTDGGQTWPRADETLVDYDSCDPQYPPPQPCHYVSASRPNTYSALAMPDMIYVAYVNWPQPGAEVRLPRCTAAWEHPSLLVDSMAPYTWTPSTVYNYHNTALGTDRSASPALYLAWVDARGSTTLPYRLRWSRSETGGAIWEPSAEVWPTGNLDDVGYVSLASGPGGQIYLLWTGRKLGNAYYHNYISSLGPSLEPREWLPLLTR